MNKQAFSQAQLFILPHLTIFTHSKWNDKSSLLKAWTSVHPYGACLFLIPNNNYSIPNAPNSYIIKKTWIPLNVLVGVHQTFQVMTNNHLLCVTHKIFIKLTINKIVINLYLNISLVTDYKHLLIKHHDYLINKKSTLNWLYFLII